MSTLGTAPVSTGLASFDEILGGGLAPHRFYLVQGVPGSGKTTLALQFLSRARPCCT
jgi:circadian clock protein KaiC